MTGQRVSFGNSLTRTKAYCKLLTRAAGRETTLTHRSVSARTGLRNAGLLVSKK
jgi:hypothetical protein